MGIKSGRVKAYVEFGQFSVTISYRGRKIKLKLKKRHMTMSSISDEHVTDNGTGLQFEGSTTPASSPAFQLSTIAKHFLVVGVLMVVVLILAAINAYLDYRHRPHSRWHLSWGSKSTPSVTRSQSSNPKITVKMRPNTNMFI
ncbi:hypothetical protein CAPTEDRAFT_205095 [Capitella teleta]|uniref:Uncharacterized protein n=1 Tax=Capitella teleta TaxID=283909 RepID=R7TS83_CAPTE|nr:hypothetical protein CAPTEDRAFT_205095 [Capitella teleta]|eukprot:ELT96768.1 hypothetical protein CAPTEDRAFT_205095 [Capitella teleta]